MKSPHPLTLAAALLGLAGALVWWNLGERPGRRPAGQPAAVTAASPPREDETAPAGPLSPATRDLLDRVRRLLLRQDARPGELLLTFPDADRLAQFQARAGQAGGSILGRADALRSLRIRVESSAALARDIAAHPDDYAGAGANVLVSVPRTPATETRPATDAVPFGNRALEFIGAGGDRSQWGRGVTIAILDTGVAADATFGTGRLTSLDVGQGIAPGNGTEDGHGTAIAALAAGAHGDAPGVAPAARLLSIRVTDADGWSDLFTLAQGIVAAADAGARVLNISLGGQATSPALEAAIAYAAARGAVLVAAAGNDQAAQLAWPAADPRVVSVGAVDAAAEPVWFSNSGPQLQLTAPGYGIQTAWLDGSRVYLNGTSASAPLVAGAIAAVLSQNPGRSAAEAAARVTATASDSGLPGTDENFGRGILNVGWALNTENTAYIDTAIASQAYDAAKGQAQVIVQNRSGRTMSGLTLKVAAGGTPQVVTVPSLAPGETYAARVPAAPDAAGQVTVAAELINPPATTDAQPSNNRRTGVLTPGP